MLSDVEFKAARNSTPLRASYHLQRPNAPDPHFQLAFYTFDIVQLNTLPPTATRRLTPEEKKFLRHADGIAVREGIVIVVALNVGTEAGECYGCDDRFVWLRGAVAPAVIVVEATGCLLACH